MALSDIARKVEKTINRVGVKRSTSKGWKPQFTGYAGYGTTEHVHVLGRVLMQDPDSENTDNWAQRGYKQFFTIQVGGHPVTAQAGKQTISGTTNANGYFDLLIYDHGLEPGWQEVTISSEGMETITTDVLIVDLATKTGIISDIDDTIMVTWLPRAMTAAWNSWVKRTNTRQPVEGMTAFFHELHEHYPDAPVFYLSTGAWNTYPTLKSFMAQNGYPRGPMLLTDWGPTPTGLFRSGQEHKKVQLRNLFINYPDMNWILIGDDGQHDPLTYGNAANDHPNRIHSVAIRNLSPQEQLLSHGSMNPLAEANEEGQITVPLIQGATGHQLAKKFRQILHKVRA